MSPRPRIFPRLWTAGLALGVLALLVVPGAVQDASSGVAWSGPAVPHALGLASIGKGVPSVSGQPLAWSRGPSLAQLGEGGGMAATAGGSFAVYFGGLGSTLSNSTEVFNETTDTWTGPITTQGFPPSPRTHFAFAADAALGEDVLFGGETNLTQQYTDNQTWIFYPANASWRHVAAIVAPAPRQDPAFAIDPTLGLGLLYGGWNQTYGGTGSLTYGDTWTLELTTNTWVYQPNGLSHPPNLHGASLLWDPAIHRFELFGGCDPCSNALWRFDPYNLTWSSVVTSGGPAGRGDAVWAYDPAQQLDVLYGGYSATYGVMSNTWTFDPVGGTGWSPDTNAPTPPGRYAASAAWLNVPTNETLLVAGGNGGSGPLTDLWRLAPTSTVDVRLLDATTGLPIDAGTVTIDSTSLSTTNLLGYGNQTQVPPGGTQVMGTKVGYHPGNASLWVEPGVTPALVVLDLVPNPHANLTVRVTSPTLVPLSGVDVNVTLGGSLWRNPPLTTNSLGYAYYTGLPSGPWLVVTAWELGYHANQTVVTLQPDQNLSLNFTLFSLPRLVLRTWGDEAPTAAGAYPFPAAEVWFNGSLSTSSGAGGWANTTFNRSGPLATMATSAYCRNGYDNVTLPYSGTTWANDTLAPWGPTGVHVHVISNATKGPLPGTDVNDTYSNGISKAQFLTDLEGYSNTSLVRAGPNTVVLWAPGYYPQSYRLWWMPGTTYFLNISLLPLPSLFLHVHGRNLHNQTVSLGGVAVYRNGAYGGLTSSTGWLNFTPAQAGLVTLFALRVDYRPGWLNLTVNTTGTQWANLTLLHLPWAILAVQVLDRDNSDPLSGALVVASMPDGNANTTFANAHGYANMTSVVGKAAATARFSGFYPSNGSATLLQYRSVPLKLSLVPYPVVRVRVLGYDQSPGFYPLPGAMVTFNGSFSGFTGRGGWLNVTSYPGGLETVGASAPLYFSAVQVLHLNYTGVLNATFFLKERVLGAFRVHVSDQFTGLAVPSASVNVTNVDPIPTTPGGTGVTLHSGWANFTGMGYGNYTIGAFHSGYRVPTLVTVHNLHWGQVHWQNLTLVPFPYSSLYTFVVDKNTSKPIDHAELLVGFSYAGYTNAAGNASLLPPSVDIPGGNYEVVASAVGYYDWASSSLIAFPIGGHVTLPTIYLTPAPKKNCTSTSQPGCNPTNNGTYTKGNFSLLPFSAGPWWPFLLLPPLFLVGALVYFVGTRKREEGRRPPGVVVVHATPNLGGPVGPQEGFPPGP